jgi:PIN domain nuclease of toxin-antitoxin system
MQLLLDTHTLIWFINGDKSLPPNVIAIIENTSNKCYVSIASVLEIAIKLTLNKLSLQSDFKTMINFLNENDVELLPITFEHIQTLLQLKLHHRDPLTGLLLLRPW